MAMKWFLVTLAIGLAACDKLDHTYLPPPGAQFAGGILGNQDAPLEPPHHTHPGTGQIIPGDEQHHPSLGVNGEPVNFGDKIPKVPFNYNQENLPTTTTSYAFSQTTTYPPTEGFNPTNLSINPVTGLPILLGQGNVPFGSTQQNSQQLPEINQGQTPVYGTNLQPGVIPQGPNTINFNQPGFNQPTNQITGQYPVQNLVNPGGVQIPGSINQLPGQNQGQLPIGQGIVQQSLLPTGPSNQPFNQYPAQNLGNNGGVVSIPGGNQGYNQYPTQGATNQGLVPSTVSPINPQSGVNQYGINYDGSQGPLTQGTYTGQPINVGEPRPTQTSYQNQGLPNIGGISQYSTEHPDVSGPRGQGSTPSYNGIASTTPFPVIPSSTSGYSSVRPVYRPERPQAEADRNAVILNYENVRTPNGYSYSFDTSNGIHADESGIVDNGTKAQGSYSYIGDDGKLYSVYYTADENGFQPRGDHLPTPPPIPEAIQRVIEQAAKDEAAGIVDDGSYDEFKYGDDKYQGISKHRRPQNQGLKTFDEQINAANNGLIKPITGIKDVEYDEGISQDQLDGTISGSEAKKGFNNNPSVKRPLNKGINENGVEDQGIRRISEDSSKPIQDFDENGRPVTKQGTFNRVNSQNKQGTARGSPVSNGNNTVFNDAEDEINNKDSIVNNQGSSRRRPTSDGGKDTLVTKYPGANVDVTTTNYTKYENDGIVDNGRLKTVSGKPGESDEYDDSTDLEYDSVTGAPIAGGKKQTLRKRIKGRPGSNNQNENQNLPGRNDVLGNAKTPSISEYIENAAKQPTVQQQTTQQDNSGYHYQQPSTTFEQNTFPTRFRPQEIPTTMKPDQRITEYVEGTTRKPFMTPNVYEQNEKASPSTTRRPFMTKGVASSSEKAYTDYNDDDYATDPDIDGERNGSTKIPVEKYGITSRPYETTRKGSRVRYGPNNQQTGVSQKRPLGPGQKTGNTETVAPGYSYGPSTTSTPSHNSRFGTTEAPKNLPGDRRPSSLDFESTTAVGRPATKSSLGQTAPDYKYQSTGPNSKYFDSNVVSGYPTSGYTPGLGSPSGNPSVSTPQNYYTSTFRPSQGYSTTSRPPTSGYQPGSGVQFPVGPTGSPVHTQDSAFHTGYHYGPPKSGNPSVGPDAGFFTPTDSSRVSPTSPTGTYQTTYQGPGGFPSTTLGPSVGGRQDNFIPSYQGSTTSPIRDHQGNFQNQPSTPGYSTTITSSPGSKTTYDYPGSPNTYKDTTGYEYGPSRPAYSTTNSPSTIGTTPGPYNPTGATVPSQGSTTYRPGFQNTEDLYLGGPVDGFGRPIPSNQGYNTGFTYPTQGPIGSYNGHNFGGNQPSTTYPGDQPRVIGEDFSGPKQPQRFDPITGYHYK